MNAYLFNPVNGVKRKISKNMLSQLTKVFPENLQSLESKIFRLKKINKYIVWEDTSKETLYELMCEEELNFEMWLWVRGSKKYQISNYGRIRAMYKKGPKLLIPYIKHDKWLVVKVDYNGEYKEYCIHRLVAEHFIPNKHNLPCVVHKNEDILDNRDDNLKWISRQDLGHETAGLAKGIPVIKIDPKTNEILDSYKNMAEAGRQNYLDRETIRQCVRGEIKTAGGFKWKIDKELYRKEKAV